MLNGFLHWLSWKLSLTHHRGQNKEAVLLPQAELNLYTGTKLINHVSVRKYTSLQLFVETKRDGSWQIPLNIIHRHSLRRVQSQTQYTKLFFIINASAVTCAALRKWEWSHRCHHVILYSDTQTQNNTQICFSPYLHVAPQANLFGWINLSSLPLTNYREKWDICINTLMHTHTHTHTHSCWVQRELDQSPLGPD